MLDDEEAAPGQQGGQCEADLVALLVVAADICLCVRERQVHLHSTEADGMFHMLSLCLPPFCASYLSPQGSSNTCAGVLRWRNRQLPYLCQHQVVLLALRGVRAQHHFLLAVPAVHLLLVLPITLVKSEDWCS